MIFESFRYRFSHSEKKKSQIDPFNGILIDPKRSTSSHFLSLLVLFRQFDSPEVVLVRNVSNKP